MNGIVDSLARARLEALFRQDETHGPWHRRLAQGLGKLVYLTARRINETLCLERAAALSFTSTISLIPLALLLIFVFDAFGSFEAARVELEALLQEYVAPDFQAEAIRGFDRVVRELRASRAAIQGVAFVVLVVSALALYRSSERTFSVIWSAGIKRGFFRKLGTFWLILTATPLILSGSLYLRESLTARLERLGGGDAVATPDGGAAPTSVEDRTWEELERSFWQRREALPPAGPEETVASDGAGAAASTPERGQGFLWWFRQLIVNWLFPISISFFAFTIIYVYLPNARVKLNTAAVAALFAACCWQLTTWGFTRYVQVAPGLKVYGVLGIIPSFLIWVYLSWFVALAGAVLGYCLQNFRVLEREVRYHIQRERISRPVQALLFLERVYRGFRGEIAGCTVEDLATEFRVPLSEVESLVEVLAESGYVIVDPRGVVTPRRSPDQVSPLEVMQAFPLGTGYRLPPGLPVAGSGVLETLRRVSTDVETTLARHDLAELLDPGAEAESAPRGGNPAGEPAPRP